MSSSLVSCAKCGAPHARRRGVTRMECEFCGSLIRVEEGPEYEELLCPIAYDSARCRETTARELTTRGQRDFEIRCQPPRWVAVWQVTSPAGEEELHPADPDAGALDRRLGLPALPLVDRGLADLEALEDVPPVAPLDAAAAEEAARSFFADPGTDAAHLRLIWYRVVDLSIVQPRGTQWGLYVVGADRVFVPDVQRQSVIGPARPGLLARFALFLAVCLAVAASSWSVATQALVLGVVASTAFLVERAWRGSLS